MITTNQIARIGAMIGEPARAAMLLALMGGQAFTATELARCAHITAPTASSHLARLVAEGLLEVERQGRHRYFRLATPDIARLLESVMQIATGISSGSVGRPATACVVTGPRDEAMRRARTCYDHFAGRLGVAISDALLAAGFIAFEDESGTVSAKRMDHLARFGIEFEAPKARTTRSGEKLPASRWNSRPLCRPCLDWSERRPHVTGAVGAAICARFLREGWVRRIGATRATLRVGRTGSSSSR